VKRAIIIGVLCAALLGLLAVATISRIVEEDSELAAPPAPPTLEPDGVTHPPSDGFAGYLYGRVTTDDDTVYVGRLRFGGDQEAFWGDYFNGVKRGNPWEQLVPAGRLTKREAVTIFGFELMHRDQPLDTGRRFMARMGDVARVEAPGGRWATLTLKNGSEIEFDLHGASDFDDGVRIWDAEGNLTDVGTRQIRRIEMLPNPGRGSAPYRLHGTVRTPQGAFTGFIQWDRRECVGSDTLWGKTDESPVSLRFDTIAAIERNSGNGARVTLLEGYDLLLSDSSKVGEGNRGLYVDDPRYGRVLVGWNSVERVDFSAGGGGPAYDAFAPGQPLSGTVTTRAGDRLSGRLVYDLDESETTETFDAPIGGVDYTIPFGMVASIEAGEGEHARVTLRSGEELAFERRGDLGANNLGLLIFVEGRDPEHVRWADVARIDLR
jgi:hypothetical protein